MIDGYFYEEEEIKQAERLYEFIDKNELYDDVFFQDLHSYETMVMMAKEAIDNCRIYLAVHILKALDEEVAEYYKYDGTSGTLNIPEPIDSVEDLYEAYEPELSEYLEERKRKGLEVYEAEKV